VYPGTAHVLRRLSVTRSPGKKASSAAKDTEIRLSSVKATLTRKIDFIVHDG
jgi:hypothetical protein